MEVNCEECAGCCIDWRTLTDAEIDQERRGRFDPLDDVGNLAPIPRDEIRAFVDEGYGDVLQPRLFAIQFLVFEGALLGLAAVYDRWTAAVAGTDAVLVATAGSVVMMWSSRLARRADAPPGIDSCCSGPASKSSWAWSPSPHLSPACLVVDPGQPDGRGAATVPSRPEPAGSRSVPDAAHTL